MRTTFPNGNTHVDGHKLALERAFPKPKYRLPDAKTHRDLANCPQYRQLMRHYHHKEK